MNPQELTLFHTAGRLRLTVGQALSYPSVKPVWAAPVSQGRRYLVLLDSQGDEIVMVTDPDELPPESQAALEQELWHSHLTAQVLRVRDARQEFGTTYWDVETDRGVREFVTENLQENAQWVTDTHLLLLDVDGNRFEIPNLAALESRSRALIETLL